MSKVKVDNATPQITDPMETAEDMVTSGNEAITKINASTGITGAGAAEVQANVKAWALVLTALAANNANKVAGRAQLTQAETAEPALMRRCRVRRNLLLGAIESFGDGAAQAVQSFNVSVEERQAKPLAVVPLNLRAMAKKTPTYASVRWTAVPGARGYLVQHATNPNDPTTYSAPISVTAARYHLTGQAVGAMIYFRVLACDPRLTPTGQTAYTAWVAVVVVG
jgi:hypothetical protein